MNIDSVIDSLQTSSGKLELILKANKMKKNPTVSFERALFCSWYCSTPHCTFCYMSSQKDLIRDKKKSRRSVESLIAEAQLCRKFGWELEFLTEGSGAFSNEEFLFITQAISHTMEDKLHLNAGIMPKKDLEQLSPYVSHVTASIDVYNPKLHKKLCPSKDLAVIDTFAHNAIESGIGIDLTVVLGVGETFDDYIHIYNAIKTYNPSKIVFYSLSPQKNTAFENEVSPPTLYHAAHVAATRVLFPEIHICAGIWTDRISATGLLICAGANGITKIPLMKVMGTTYGKKIESEVASTNRQFLGTLTDVNITQIPKNRDPYYYKPRNPPKLPKNVLTQLERYDEKVLTIVASYIKNYKKNNIEPKEEKMLF